MKICRMTIYNCVLLKHFKIYQENIIVFIKDFCLFFIYFSGKNPFFARLNSRTAKMHFVNVENTKYNNEQ